MALLGQTPRLGGGRLGSARSHMAKQQGLERTACDPTSPVNGHLQPANESVKASRLTKLSVRRELLSVPEPGGLQNLLNI